MGDLNLLLKIFETDCLSSFKESFKDLNKIYRTRSGRKETALTLSIAHGAKKITKYLLDQDDIDVYRHGKNGETPLIAAVKGRNLDIVKRLMEKGADLTVHSAFPAALKEGNVEMVKCLLKHGARLDRIDLVRVVWDNHYDLLKYLNTIGANVNISPYRDCTPLTKAVSLQNFKITKYLVEVMDADINLVGRNGISALSFAALERDFSLAKYLVEKGADVNLVHDGDKSALSFAASNKDFRLSKYLIENGADLLESREELDKFASLKVDFRLYLESVKAKRTLKLSENPSTNSTDCGQCNGGQNSNVTTTTRPQRARKSSSYLKDYVK